MSAKLPQNPVILVHGIDDTGAVFQPLSFHLQQRGWRTYAPSLAPNNGACGLEELAQQLKTFIDRTVGAEQPIDIVGFSMGGIVSRYYVQRLGGSDRVQRFMTVASPHNGSFIAHGRWNCGCRQMCPGSPFLADLNGDLSVLARLNFTSIWTPYDLMILPARSSQIGVGREIIVPVMLHSWMIRDRRSLTIVTDLLQEPLRSPSDAPEAPAQTASPIWA